MKTLTLHDGTEMPAFGLGTWKPKGEDVYRAVRSALAAGYAHIDCAAIYGNEPAIGRALADAFAAGDARREDVWVTSKLWNTEHEPDRVRPALEKTLADLGLDRIDLYLMHWPVALRPGTSRASSPADFFTPEELPIETTWEAMIALREGGLARQIGVSNFNVPKIRRLGDATGVLPAANQVELHPYLQQSDLLAGTGEMGVVLTAYSPMGTPDSGEMFGRKDPFKLLDDPVLADVATAHTATPGQVLIAWALQRGTSVIPKSTNEGRIRENLQACEITLTADEMASIARLERGHRYVDGRFWCPEGGPWTLETLWGE